MCYEQFWTSKSETTKTQEKPATVVKFKYTLVPEKTAEIEPAVAMKNPKKREEVLEAA